MTVQKDAPYLMNLLQNCVVEGYANGAQAMQAWGAHSFKGSEQSDKYGLSWIQFKTEGSKHIGWVRVALKGIDIANDAGVFTITLEKFNNLSAEYGVTASEHNVKPADLATVIDRLVEG